MTARRAIIAAAALLASGSALAHTGVGSGHGLGAGLIHPIAGWDHLLAAVAVGVWAARHRGSTVWALPLLFLSTMIAGVALALGGLALPGIEPAILLSLIVFGGALALRPQVSVGMVAAVLAGFAVLHGNAHGLELPGSAGQGGYLLGLLLATGALHGAGVLAGRTAPPFAMRLFGLAIGGGGLWMLAAV